MDRIITVGSGSSGNCYIIECQGKKIIIDLGIRFSRVLNALNHDVSNISCAIVSHEHLDHAKYIPECSKYGIPIYANERVCEKFEQCKTLNVGQVLKVDGFTIMTFGLIHDVPNNAFVIKTNNGIKILFCTDTKRIPMIVKDVNYAIIECNYSEEILLENALKGNANRSHYFNHQELKECINYLSKIKSNCLRGVILTHISQGNGDGELFVNKVVEELGLYNVEYAQSGLEMPIGTDDF